MNIKSSKAKAQYTRQATLAEYLLARCTQDESGCWLWSQGTDKNGYGMAIDTRWHHRTGKSRAHQLSYLAWRGPIKDGFLVCHSCDNPPCIRPDHLFTGSNLDNVKDMQIKGRSRSGSRPTVNYQIIQKMRGSVHALKIAELFHISWSRVYQIWRGEFKHAH